MFGWLKPKPVVRWKTLAILPHKAEVTNAYNRKVPRPVTLYYVLKSNSREERRVDFEGDAGSDMVRKFLSGQEDYILHMVPWLEGTITLEELVKALPGLKFPNAPKG